MRRDGEASFWLAGGELIVTDLDENGILAQREFNDGDVIARIAYSKSGSIKTAASARGNASALAGP